jgi:hypothetical protein
MGRFSSNEQRTIAAVVTLTVLIGWSILAGPADTVDVDHRAHEATVAGLDDGYYRAMTDAMMERDDGPSGSVRAWRLPTLFWLWSMIGTQWWTYLVVLAFGCIALIWLLPRPLLVPFLALYLAVNSFPHLDRGWQAQWLTVELWAVLLACAAVAFWWRQMELPAAAAAVGAALLREHLVLLVAGGAVQAWRKNRPLWPWIGGLGLFAVAYAIHTVMALPFVADVGFEAPLWWTGGLAEAAAMAGFGLPASSLVGPALIGFALWRSRRDLMPMPLLLLPLTGFVGARPYWGLMVVPVAIVVLVDGTPVDRRERAAPRSGVAD